MAAEPILLTAKLQECRDAMKELFGDAFQAQIKPRQEIIQAYAVGHGTTILESTLVLAKDLVAADYSEGVPLLLAAAVELIEA